MNAFPSRNSAAAVVLASDSDHAVAVANQLGSPSTVIEASSKQLADTLFAATVAAELNGAVLLSDS